MQLPYNCFNWFVGCNTGIKRGGPLISPKTWAGYYIEHIALFYWVLGPLSIIVFKPVHISRQSPDPTTYLWYAFGIIIWLTTNIIFDCLSLLFTKYSLSKVISESESSLFGRIKWLFYDFMFAALCFFLTLMVVQGVYAIQTHQPQNFFRNMIDYRVAFEPYYLNILHPSKNNTFPMQIVTSGTSYIPTFIGLAWTFCFMIFYEFARLCDRIVHYIYKHENVNITYVIAIICGLGFAVSLIW